MVGGLFDVKTNQRCSNQVPGFPDALLFSLRQAVSKAGAWIVVVSAFVAALSALLLIRRPPPGQLAFHATIWLPTKVVGLTALAIIAAQLGLRGLASIFDEAIAAYLVCLIATGVAIELIVMVVKLTENGANLEAAQGTETKAGS